ncbi:hypothetical protein [Clostridium merdae]|uniref:hypothetical protein n=1 Tax=Clostridium merdae TaxID=1958780 RepID=UPI000A26E6E3|nr:hypothetical protein [Clostridium merdae]
MAQNNRQIRLAIFHNEFDGTKQYAEQLASKLDVETALINFMDARPCTEVLPLRATPNVALLLFVDSLEELQEQIDILRQLRYIRKQETVTGIVDELVDVARDNIPDELAVKIANTFYSE